MAGGLLSIVGSYTVLGIIFCGSCVSSTQKRADPDYLSERHSDVSNSTSKSLTTQIEDIFTIFWREQNQGLCPVGQVPQRNNTVCCWVNACQPEFEIEECTVNGTEDTCQKCKDGYRQPNNVSSLDMENAKCFKVHWSHGMCPIQDTKPARHALVPLLRYPCQCKFEECRKPDGFGFCPKGASCGLSYQMNPTNGTCEPCPWYAYKNEVGCQPCTLNITLLRFGGYIPRTTITTAVTTTSLDILDKTSEFLETTKAVDQPGGNDTDGSPVPLVVVLILTLIVLCVAVTVAVICYFKRRQAQASTTPEDSPLMNNNTPVHTPDTIVNGYLPDHVPHVLNGFLPNGHTPLQNGQLPNGQAVLYNGQAGLSNGNVHRVPNGQAVFSNGNVGLPNGHVHQVPNGQAIFNNGLAGLPNGNMHQVPSGQAVFSNGHAGLPYGHMLALNSETRPPRQEIEREKVQGASFEEKHSVSVGGSNSSRSSEEFNRGLDVDQRRTRNNTPENNLNIIPELPNNQQLAKNSAKILNSDKKIEELEPVGAVGGMELKNDNYQTYDSNDIEEKTYERDVNKHGNSDSEKGRVHISVSGNTFNYCRFKIGGSGVKYERKAPETEQMNELRSFSVSYGGESLDSSLSTGESSVEPSIEERKRNHQPARPDKPVQKVAPLPRGPQTMEQSTRHDSAHAPGSCRNNREIVLDNTISNNSARSYAFIHQSDSEYSGVIRQQPSTPDVANMDDFSILDDTAIQMEQTHGSNIPSQEQTCSATEENPRSSSSQSARNFNRSVSSPTGHLTQSVRPYVARQQSASDGVGPGNSSITGTRTECMSDHFPDQEETERKQPVTGETTEQKFISPEDNFGTEFEPEDKPNNFTQEMEVLKEMSISSRDSNTCLKQLNRGETAESSFEIGSEDVQRVKDMDVANEESDSFEIFSEDLISVGSGNEKQFRSAEMQQNKSDGKCIGSDKVINHLKPTSSKTAEEFSNAGTESETSTAAVETQQFQAEQSDTDKSHKTDRASSVEEDNTDVTEGVADNEEKFELTPSVVRDVAGESEKKEDADK